MPLGVRGCVSVCVSYEGVCLCVYVWVYLCVRVGCY